MLPSLTESHRGPDRRKITGTTMQNQMTSTRPEPGTKSAWVPPRDIKGPRTARSSPLGEDGDAG